MADAYKNIVEIPERGYHYFRHYFIPHEGNDHRPLVVRPNALKTYSAILIMVKVLLTGFLYAVYPTQAQFAELTASKIFELTNESRTAEGLRTLTMSSALSAAANNKAQDMLSQGYFDHTGPDGKKFWQWIAESGYAYATAGENLAMDFTTAESAHNALMNSPSHRANIVKSAYTEIGLAVVEGSLNGKATTLLVEYFAAPSVVVPVNEIVEEPSQPVEQPAEQPSTPEPQQPATPTPTPTAPTPAPPPTYIAEFVGMSDEEFALLPDSELTMWVDFRNAGTAIWTNDGTNYVALNVTDPTGRTSAFASDDWVTTFRPAVLQQDRVRPGEVGRFLVPLQAPTTLGEHEEAFAMVAEGLKFIDGGTVTVPISVVEPPQPVVAAEEETASPQDEIRSRFTTTSVDVVQTDDEPQILPATTPPPLVVGQTTQQSDWQRNLIDWSIRFFWAFLAFLVVSLVLTIVVRIRVQHGHVIVQTLLVIALTASMALIKFHFIERIADIVIR